MGCLPAAERAERGVRLGLGGGFSGGAIAAERTPHGGETGLAVAAAFSA